MKDLIIQAIKFRIIEEHRKHPNLDWEEIAAHKIYSSFIDKTSNQTPTANPNIHRQP